MTPDFSPSDREHDSVDAFLGSFSGDGLLGNAAASEVSDHWIDEALRSVPLPEGFLTRMGRLAQSAQTNAQSANPA